MDRIPQSIRNIEIWDNLARISAAFSLEHSKCDFHVSVEWFILNATVPLMGLSDSDTHGPVIDLFLAETMS